jgi:hypothetical protein
MAVHLHDSTVLAVSPCGQWPQGERAGGNGAYRGKPVDCRVDIEWRRLTTEGGRAAERAWHRIPRGRPLARAVTAEIRSPTGSEVKDASAAAGRYNLYCSPTRGVSPTVVPLRIPRIPLFRRGHSGPSDTQHAYRRPVRGCRILVRRAVWRRCRRFSAGPLHQEVRNPFGARRDASTSCSVFSTTTKLFFLDRLPRPTLWRNQVIAKQYGRQPNRTTVIRTKR